MRANAKSPDEPGVGYIEGDADDVSGLQRTTSCCAAPGKCE